MFLDGSEPGYADYMIWPWFERLRAFAHDERVRLEPSKYSLLVRTTFIIVYTKIIYVYILRCSIWGSGTAHQRLSAEILAKFSPFFCTELKHVN